MLYSICILLFPRWLTQIRLMNRLLKNILTKYQRAQKSITMLNLTNKGNVAIQHWISLLCISAYHYLLKWTGNSYVKNSVDNFRLALFISSTPPGYNWNIVESGVKHKSNRPPGFNWNFFFRLILNFYIIIQTDLTETNPQLKLLLWVKYMSVARSRRYTYLRKVGVIFSGIPVFTPIQLLWPYKWYVAERGI
jgi:hypothetical protein